MGPKFNYNVTGRNYENIMFIYVLDILNLLMKMFSQSEL
jgi:hypothetical protein